MSTMKSVKLTVFKGPHPRNLVIIPIVQNGKPTTGQNARIQDALEKESRSKSEKSNVFSPTEPMLISHSVIGRQDQRLRRNVSIETARQNGDHPSGANAARSVETEEFRFVYSQIYNYAVVMSPY